MNQQTATAGPTMVPGPRAGDSRSMVADAALASGSDRYLTFQLGGERYALPILDIVEIIEYRPLTTVPSMPGYIHGVLNLRGSAVPVVDLSVRFQQAATEIARRTSVIIVDVGAGRGTGTGRRMGILVDAVHKVLHLTRDDIEPPPDLGGDLRADVIKGMARQQDGFIAILDLDHLLPHGAPAF